MGNCSHVSATVTIDNKSQLIQLMASLVPLGNKPLSEPMLTQIYVVIYSVIKPQWVNGHGWNSGETIDNQISSLDNMKCKLHEITFRIPITKGR